MPLSKKMLISINYNKLKGIQITDFLDIAPH